MLTLWWLACQDGGIKLDSTASEPDSEPIEVDDSRPGSPTESETEPEIVATLTFLLNFDPGEASLGLTPLLPDASGELQMVDAFAGVPIAGTEVDLPLPAPDLDWLIELGRGVRGVILVPSVHVDENGDHLHQDTEQVVGVGENWVLFLAGGVPGALADRGFTEGYNAFSGVATLSTVLDAGWVDPQTVPLSVGLVPDEDTMMGGRYDPAEELRFALVPLVVFDGAPITTLLYDEALVDEVFYLDLTGRPPEDHHQTFEEVSATEARYATEVPVAYQDLDQDGAVSEGDVARYAACFGGQRVLATWVEPPDDLYYAWYLTVIGAGAGWNIYSTDESGELTWLSSRDATTLTLDASCPLE